MPVLKDLKSGFKYSEKYFSLPEIAGTEANAAENNQRRAKLIATRDRLRQADKAQRARLRVLQVAATSSWEVANELENIQYGETEDADVAAAKKAAEAKKKGREKKDDASVKTKKGKWSGQDTMRPRFRNQEEALQFWNPNYSMPTHSVSGAFPLAQFPSGMFSAGPVAPPSFGHAGTAFPSAAFTPATFPNSFTPFSYPTANPSAFIPAAVQQSQQSASSISSQSNPSTFVPGQGQTQSAPRRPFICYLCGKEGHSSKNCPDRIPK
jgi:Zinc knuckle